MVTLSATRALQEKRRLLYRWVRLTGPDVGARSTPLGPVQRAQDDQTHFRAKPEAKSQPRTVDAECCSVLAHCVIALASLHLVISGLGVHLDLAISTVKLGVRRGITDAVLAAQFVLNLLKRLPQLLLLIADFDHPAAGLFRQLPHFGVAAVAESAVEAPVSNEDDVADRVSLLRGFNSLLDLQTASLVFAVGENDHRLAPDFVLQLLVRAEINCVVKQRAARVGGWNWSSAQSRRAAAKAGVDLHLVQRPRQVTNIVGEILVEVHIHVKVDDEGEVLVPQYAVQELSARFLLDGQNSRLAGAGVDHDSQRQWLVGFCREILDGLRLAVFEHLKIVFGEVRNQHAVLVLHVEEQVYDVHFRLEGL